MEESRPLKRALIDDAAGDIFGSISRRATSPSDVTKIRFQVQLEPTSSWALLRLLGFWRGNVPALLMVMLCTSIQFADHIHSSPYLSGALVGCATTVRSYPFHLLRTILASQGEPKSGLSRTLVKIIPYAGLQFGTYDTFKRWTLHESLSSFQLFACGLASGTCVEAVCHTLDVVKNRFHIIGHRIVDLTIDWV
ncbi:hypothetical protein MKW92_010587, partial [Papaver armeniacum]